MKMGGLGRVEEERDVRGEQDEAEVVVDAAAAGHGHPLLRRRVAHDEAQVRRGVVGVRGEVAEEEEPVARVEEEDVVWSVQGSTLVMKEKEGSMTGAVGVRSRQANCLNSWRGRSSPQARPVPWKKPWSVGGSAVRWSGSPWISRRAVETANLVRRRRDGAARAAWVLMLWSWRRRPSMCGC